MSRLVHACEIPSESVGDSQRANAAAADLMRRPDEAMPDDSSEMVLGSRKGGPLAGLDPPRLPSSSLLRALVFDAVQFATSIDEGLRCCTTSRTWRGIYCKGSQ